MVPLLTAIMSRRVTVVPIQRRKSVTRLVKLLILIESFILIDDSVQSSVDGVFHLITVKFSSTKARRNSYSFIHCKTIKILLITKTTGNLIPLEHVNFRKQQHKNDNRFSHRHKD